MAFRAYMLTFAGMETNSKGMETKILVVDDEETLCEALRFNLEAEGYFVATAGSAEEALTMHPEDFDLFILDIMMGAMSGTQLARILKESPATASTPIIFCTARDSEDDLVRGLDLGADDYIPKPFSIRTLLARVRSVLRRARNAGNGEAEPDALVFEGLRVIPDRKLCLVDGQEVKMPRKEFEILRFLLSAPGRIFSRDEILDALWPDHVVVTERVVDVHITRLRAKLGDYGRHLVSRSGYGYTFTY